MIAGLLIVALTVALVLLDFGNERRRANDQLDVAGQSLVESLHRDLRNVQNLLIRSESIRFEGPVEPADRLSAISALPYVRATGYATSSDGPVTWLDDRTLAITPLDRSLIDEPRSDSQRIFLDMVADDLLISHPYSVTGERVWDMALVDMDALAESVVPASLDAGITWNLSPVPEGTALVEPETDVHREYLILDEDASWLFELKWTPAALEAQGIGFDWGGVLAGVAVALLVGVLAAKWMQRRYIEADLRATKELLDQKDLLLKALSHQLRTPLTGVIGFLRLALDESPETMSPGQRIELAELALGQAEGAAELVEDMFVAARIRDTSLVTVIREVEIEPLLQRVFDTVTNGDGELDFSDPERVTSIAADPLRARQLFRNIFSGGREAGSTSWSVSIREQGADVIVSLSAEVPLTDESPRLTPENVAMPEDVTAIGPRLEIARSLCETMGGSFTLTTSSDGTELTLRFPAFAGELSDPAVITTG